MTVPPYYGPRDLEGFLRAWAKIIRLIFGLHAGLAFERMIEDLRQERVGHELTLRDLHRGIESRDAELEQVRGY